MLSAPSCRQPPGPPRRWRLPGDIGIGKTMVWRHVVRTASRSSRVLSCQPALSERPLSFSALDDLLGEVERKSSRCCRALAGQPCRPCFSVAHLRALTRLTVPTPFAPRGSGRCWREESWIRCRPFRPKRRLESSPGTTRNGWTALPQECFSLLSPPAQRACNVPADVSRGKSGLPARPGSGPAAGSAAPCATGPVEPDPSARSSGHGWKQSRPATSRLGCMRRARGNPFYALECARALLEHPHLPLASEPIPIPVPRSLSGLMRRRMRQLTPNAQRVGQLVAASS